MNSYGPELILTFRYTQWHKLLDTESLLLNLGCQVNFTQFCIVAFIFGKSRFWDPTKCAVITLLIYYIGDCT